MKKSYVFLGLMALTLMILVISNPNQQQHQEAVKDAYLKALTKQQGNSGALVKGITRLFAPSLIDQMVKNQVRAKNYVLFSLTEAQESDGRRNTIGFGIFGNVFLDGKLTKDNSPNNEETNAELKSKWQELTPNLRRKAEIAINLRTFMIASSISPALEQSLNELLQNANELETVCSSSDPGKDVIEKANNSYNKLSLLLRQCLQMYEQEEHSYQSDHACSSLKTQLEGVENRINVYRRDYNEEVQKDGRPELLFVNK